MEIKYLDGTEELIEKANQKNSEVDDNIYLIYDEENNLIVEININSIKRIKWK